MALTPIVVPKLGMDTTEALLTQWFVPEGGYVTKGDPLVELESEKVTFAYEAEASGKLVQVVAAAGEQVGMGALIGYLDTD